MENRLVVIGASYAGTQVAFAARERGFEGEIVLLGAEPHLPYQRPPLSKGYLQGKLSDAALLIKTDAAFRKKAIDFRPGSAVTAIDRTRREVVTASGDRLTYGKLALATGARVRRLTIPGAELTGIHYLRDLADSQRLAAAVHNARRVVIIGGGFIGLEAAASLRGLGLEVSVIEPEDRLLKRAFPPVLSDWTLKLHRRHGVAIHLGRSVTAIEGVHGAVSGVVLDDGATLACDLVVAGIGVDPEDDLAQAAGLHTDHGIVVDARAVTSDPDIVAAGDCTLRPDPWAPGGPALLRVHSVQNAVDQAKVAGATLAGQEATHGAVPWFWSDQFDVKFQMVGHGAPGDEIIPRGDPANGFFSLFHFRDGRLHAVDSVNSAQDHMVARKLLTQGATPTKAEVADPTVALQHIALD
jgi:3-phenylpropionate/trans-cinnamate dioxygenase ferredoxin reductase subunit